MAASAWPSGAHTAAICGRDGMGIPAAAASAAILVSGSLCATSSTRDAIAGGMRTASYSARWVSFCDAAVWTNVSAKDLFLPLEAT